MSSEKSTKLLEFILEKERAERLRKRRLYLGLGAGGTTLLAIVLALVLWPSTPESAPPPPEKIYALHELDGSSVAKLLEARPAGVRVLDSLTGDTILLRNIREYALLRLAEADERHGILSPAEWEEDLSGETQVEVLPTVNDAQRAIDIRRKVAAEGPLREADVMPAFPGGEAALRRFLSRQLRYPTEASRNKVQGTVYLRFVINEAGEVEEPEVMRGIGGGCDEEALRVLAQMPPWIPGEVAGVKVPVFATLAINFRFL